MSVKARTFKSTTLLSTLFACSLLGLGQSKITNTGADVTWVVLVLIVVLITYKKRTVPALFSMALLGILVGSWRGGEFLQRVEPYTSLAGQVVKVQVRAETSAVYGKSAQLEFEASAVEFVDPIQQKMPGKMVISGFGTNSILRGDIVTAEGKMYQRRGSKQAGISYAKIAVVERSSSVLEKVRRDFMAGLATALPEPHDQFAAGLLVGQRSEMPSGVTETLRIVGLSHIIAVSGYNLTIMAELARKRFGKKSQFKKAFFSVCFVLAFVALAGSSASIARAAFVSLLTIIAGYYGKNIKPHVILLLAASLTALMNPLNVWNDIGWYLSFLAFFGVLIIAPAVTGRLYKKEPKLIGKLIIETSSAQLATLPLILFLFGDLSVVSLLANMLIVPLVPLAMLLSFIAGVAGMVLPEFALLLGFPARLLMDVMLGISSLVASIPNALIKINLSVWQMLGCYAGVVMILIVLHNKSKNKPPTVPEASPVV